MRLSTIWRILQINEGVIDRGRRAHWQKKTWQGKAAWGIVSTKAVAVCSIVALVCPVRTRNSHQSCSLHDLYMVSDAGDRGPAYRGCGQEQSSGGRGVQTPKKQWLWETRCAWSTPRMRRCVRLPQRAERARVGIWAVKQEFQRRVSQWVYRSRSELLCISWQNCPTFKVTMPVEITNIRVAGELFSFTLIGLKYGVEGLPATLFSLFATAGVLPVRCVTSLFNARTTSGGVLTHAIYHCSKGRIISAAHSWPNRHSASVRVKRATMAWSRWISERPQIIYVFRFCILWSLLEVTTQWLQNQTF